MNGHIELTLMVMSGPDDGLVHALEGSFILDEHLNEWTCRFTIGRRDSSDVVIPFDTLVSRLHASLEVTPEGELWLVDEQSRNGTFIGREKVTIPIQLEEGNFFRIGNTQLRVQQIVVTEGV